MASFICLRAARQARLAAVAWPDFAGTHKARARFWLAKARRHPGPRLP